MTSEPQYGIPPDLIVGPSAMALPLSDEVNWGMDVFGVQKLREACGDAMVPLGIVDTGVDANHPILTNVKGARDFTGSQFGAFDRHGHGTHCSGTVGATDPRIGVATGFPLYHGKGLGDSGSGGSGLLRAIEYCLSEGCKVVSNSWGGGGMDPNAESQYKAWAEHPSKPWLIFAGGNSGPNTPDTDWPGRSRHLLNVAALDRNLSPAGFSSAGDKIDTSGPGVDIWSAKPGGGFQQMSGTSMATPFVAGVLGLYRAALEAAGLPIPTIYELRELLFSDSTDAHLPGDDRRSGPGWITPLLLTLNLTPDPKAIKK